MNNKYVILVSPSSNEIELVRRLGYKSILLKKEVLFDEIINVDIPIEFNLNHEEEVLKKCVELSNKYEIISVFTLNEYRIPLASLISKTLGLKNTLSYDAALVCRNKKLTRTKLDQLDIGRVKYTLLTETHEVEEGIKGFTFPLIVKPSNDAGSRNVYLCNNMDEVTTAVTTIRSDKVNFIEQPIDEILVEEFIDGPEYSVESYTLNGITKVIGITQKEVTPFPLAIEIGHNFPAKLSREVEEEIVKLVIKSLEAIGVDNAVTHAEVKYTKNGPRLIEVNARPGGDQIPELVLAVTGIDLREIAFRISLGEDIGKVTKSDIVSTSASIRFLTADKAGEVYFNENINTTLIKKQEWFIENGQQVEKTTNNYNRLGFYITHNDEENSASEIANIINEKLGVTIKDLIVK
ncbi:ATP-grasp domain-containing protein [Chengkuizengella axinellae]|uniref:ATP-grasp domain-containing protein n=1 Tax=Chengkuizengella axinellae TaxID=3064388 RepID=A0ABT9J590_9BACL|nr:ATP-grasp domain-containing protein [Chengkuizengella sp. 2205SS18-9]MDP5276632.1 ATP-grasp domain-containing protein [Chengkuizengella sp. 2205SS18-9]